jgi:hypothetical protein
VSCLRNKYMKCVMNVTFCLGFYLHYPSHSGNRLILDSDLNILKSNETKLVLMLEVYKNVREAS